MRIYMMGLVLMLCLLTACQGSVAPSPQPEIESPSITEAQSPDVLVTDEPPASTSVPVLVEVPLYDEYFVSLEVEPESRNVKGIERIKFTNRTEAPLTEIVCRVYLNAFSEQEAIKPYFSAYQNRIFASGVDYGYMNVLHVSLDNEDLPYTLKGTVLTIDLAERPLLADETIQVKIQFDAYIPLINHRTGANGKAIWFAQFLPVLSVYGSNGWHKDPYYPAGDPFFTEIANYTVEITTPSGYQVTGTGIKKEDILDDQKITTLTAQMTRDFAFALSADYQVAQCTTPSGVDIYLYYYTPDLRVNEILEIAKTSMEYFQQTVGAYPYNQLCIAETEMFLRGMEFSKIVFMDSLYLQRTQDFNSVMHEIGHQWFFNLIGSNPIAEAWLDEGVNSYVEEGIRCQTEEALRTKIEADYENLKKQHDNINEKSRRISSGVSAYETWSDYYYIQYLKAKIMLYALNRMMGDEVFNTFLKEYYKAYSFKIATSYDFIQKAEEVSGMDLKAFFNTWLNSESLPPLPK